MSRRAYDVRLGEPAEADLEKVAAWYEERHPSGSERFFQALEQVLNVLSTFPHAGRLREDLREDLHSYVVYPFQIFYTVNDSARELMIERVLHGRLDITTDDF